MKHAPNAAQRPTSESGTHAKTQGSTPGASATRKHFVLDTNVLLHNPNSLYKFDEHEVIIPLQVLSLIHI